MATDRIKFEEELEELRSKFKGQCKIIETTGKFIKTVKLHPENLDIVINFKLTESYPSIVPVIEIRSESLDNEELQNLETALQLQASSGQSPMQALVNTALEWLQNEHINLSGARLKCNKPSMGNKKSKHSKRQQKNKLSDLLDRGKKPPMKTAIDVVKRILWDGDLEQDQFLVGYIDRMEGLKEKYFSAFSWEDIASVDYTVLAIPKHRIQYFKYKDEIVWDKRCRLDNVFGSTGSKITIKEVILKIEGENNNVEANAHVKRSDLSEEMKLEHDSDYYESDDSDSDSDDGINVTIGDGNDKGTGNHEKDNYVADDSDSDTEQESKYWRDKLRPNYFYALRITDEDIRNGVSEIQKQIIDNESKLKDCAIPSGALHITLCTVGLETEEHIANAVKGLEEAHSELASIFPKDKRLTFKGVGSFFNRVIYGKVLECPPELYKLVEHLKACITSSGIEIRDYHDFVPHMTIMKVSRPVAKMTGNNYIAPWLYSSFSDTVLGSQAVDNIHLCPMTDQRQPDGFYMAAASHRL